VHECVALAHTERIGLRYLHVIVPPDGENGLPDFLAPGVLGLNSQLPSNVQVSHTFSETLILAAECNVLARTIIQAGPLGFPMDLQPMGVKISDRFANISGIHAVIDTDASLEERRTFSLEHIESQLKILPEGVNVAFDATVTEHAVSAWND
jgi:uncharacterized protein (TIGR04255 family)